MTFDSLVNLPIFDIFGVPAVISYGTAHSIDVVAIDRTKGVEVEDLNVGVVSVRPVAAVRAASLAGLDLAEIEQGNITLNGTTWRIKAVMERPTPFGAADGQLWLVLMGGS